MPTTNTNPRLRGFQSLRGGDLLPIGDYFKGSPADGAQGLPISVRAVLDLAGLSLDQLAGSGMARYAPFLPLSQWPRLGEGGTPVVALPSLAAELGVAQLTAKVEGQNPTGSHKDRMSPLVVERARALGHPIVAAASSGNAGVSLAAYAAAAGLRCVILSTRGINRVWRMALERLGAEIHLTETSFERWERLKRGVEQEGWYPATNFLLPPVGSNPWGVQGYKTVAYEIAEQSGDTLPNVIVVPTSRGDLLWGIAEGFLDLLHIGALRALPRLYAVEPFARLSHVLAGADFRATFEGTTKLASIAGNTVTWQSIDALRTTNGGAVEVTDDATFDARARLARCGLYVEGSSAAALAAVTSLKAQGRIAAEESVLLLLTSHGFKDEPPSG